MRFLDRNFPMPLMILRGIKLRAITPHMLRIRSEERAAKAAAREAEAPKVDPKQIPESSILQTRLYKPEHVQFKEIDMDVDKIQLDKNQVIFVTQSSILNKYILYYNEVYLSADIDGIIDPWGDLNSKSFKSIPSWGICSVYRSTHPDIPEGTRYHGFFPIGPYHVRSVEGVDHSQGIAMQRPPDFKGPLEWLRLVRTDQHQDFIADLFEYFKIGMAYAGLLKDMDYYGAEQLVLSSASSMSAQIIAMCVKENRLDFPIVGLTSQRNLKMVKEFSYFDEAHTYDDIALCDGSRPSLYFDTLGWESVTISCFEHFSDIKRWWAYGQGGEKSLENLLKLNRKGSLYSNVIDALHYANNNGISDGEILSRSEALNQKHDLEQKWGANYRTITRPGELYELYNAFLQNTHPSGERVRYISPLLSRE